MDEREIFERALDLDDPCERDACLAEACGGDDALRARVEALLHSHEEAGSFLQGAAAAPSVTVGPPVTEKPGTQIGPYQLREQIGEGGFGAVFVAEQEKPVARKVALKVIKAGMDTRAVVARFEAERQALALMDHPHIAKVLDAGATESGRPYFVMELVKGASLIEFCDAQRLGTRQRLELFIEVCRAVQHAHQKGIIHRDLKPSNVMVTMRDDRAIPKVIDFGVAKALSQKLTEKTIYTGYGQLVGTPLYMSPEQAQMNEIDVDTRSDVYSLGILLYELLTGTTPFDRETIKQASFDELRRIIREDEPPRPSDRISTLRAEQLSTVSDRRNIDSVSLARSLRGELDWIVMKALEKDRNRRYESASAFVADVERYLNDEPVQACPPSAWYQLRKFTRRHKGMVTAVAAGLLLVALTAVGIGWVISERSNRQRLLAAKAEQALTALDRLEGSNQWEEALRVAKHAQSLLSSDGANEEFKTRVNADVKDLSLIVRIEQLRMSDAKLLMMDESRAAERSRHLLKEYRAAFEAWSPGAEQSTPESTAERIRSMDTARQLAVIAGLDEWRSVHRGLERNSGSRKLDRDSGSISWLDNTLVLASDYHERRGETVELEIDVVDVSSAPSVLVVRKAAGLFEEGDREKAINMLEHIAMEQPADFWVHLQLGQVYDESLQPLDAVRHYERALTLRPAGSVYHNLGAALLDTGQPEAAIQAFQKALQLECDGAPTRWLLADALRAAGRLMDAETTIRALIEEEPGPSAHSVLASIFLDQGELENAEAECRKALALALEDRWRIHTDLGNVLARMNRLEEATKEYEKARRFDPGSDPDSWHLYSNMGQALVRMNRVEDAIRAFKESIKRNPSRPGDYNAVGALYANSNRHDLALKYFMDAYRLSAASPQWRPDFKASVCCNLGLLLCMHGEYRSGLEMFRQAIQFDPENHDALTNLSWELATSKTAALRDPEAAIQYAERAVELEPKNGNDWGNLGTAFVSAGKWEPAREAFEKADRLKEDNCDHCFHAAMAYWQLGNQVRARREFDRAVTWMEKNKPNDEELQSFREQAQSLMGIQRADE